MLKRSNDRKVTNAVSPNGKTATVANTFGLPAGKAYSCPGATSICESVCYAGKLEKIYKGVRDNLLHNWNLLKDADHDTMVQLIDEMINEFKKDSDKRKAPYLFRIHWDGDFFNDTYTYAWKNVIEKHSDVQFWVYTRVQSAALIIKDIPNLSLYFSADDDNIEIAETLSIQGIRLAYLGKTFKATESKMKELTGKVGAMCPENKKSIPLISQEGSACVRCSLCVFGKADIRFSASKK
ncbi:Gene 88 protein [uncultured Caudovirales phage]|uniref:Gene 88 protein n=1 Tax=uncultured Caudovirales phage TaxID=2100421 RepID=A0A6J5MIB1_9CAUD|nr:Gene 88 protein [uncultured Caudovirales phage]CAB4150807.1 Gene 88 protein [uncultured Caudovirales phage]CAB4175189.1 Gene 88 protein [uncultured Caudovirales phage]CAB4179662.1 Gene 88 protein [uncultured Caudovirales phage]CAB4185786.1 Gene 88 protein [uncultured Caudovirales phage]